MNSNLSIKTKGWMGWALILLLSFWIFGSKAGSIIAASQAKVERFTSIGDHQRRLNIAKPFDQSTEYRSFVFQHTSDSDLTNDVQSWTLDVVRRHQARLTDLREITSPTQIKGLTSLSFRLEMEGDLGAILETIAALGASDYPLLVDRLVLRTDSPSKSPDQLIRVSADIVIWVVEI